MPELAELLRAHGGPGLLDDAAAQLAHLTRATARFLEFVQEFAPDAPPERPEHEWAQVDWSKMKRAVGQVYGYRSAVLHAGEPFPAPLLEVPWAGDMAFPAERPLGLGTALGSTTWAAKDLPMHLHVFAGTVRRALLGWWGRLAGPDAGAA